MLRTLLSMNTLFPSSFWRPLSTALLLTGALLAPRAADAAPATIVAAPNAVFGAQMNLGAREMNAQQRARLRAIQGQAESDLRENVLPFWTNDTWDTQGGGFITHLDRTGKRTGETDKYLVMQARMTWTLAAALRHGVANKKYADLARDGAHFLVDKMWDKTNGGFFFAVKRDGSPLDDTKRVYGQEFAIYALAEYALATADPTEKTWAVSWAEKTFDQLQLHAADAPYGYLEDFSREWRFLRANLAGGGELHKSLNTHMHLMEALTVLAQVSARPDVKTALGQVTDLIVNKTIHPIHGGASDPFDLNWNIAPDEQGRIKTSYGHNVEFAWLLLDAVDTLGVPRATIRDKSLGLVDHALRFGFDRERGGLADFGPLDGPTAQATSLGQERLDKGWWQQAEALTAFIEMYRWTGEPKYLEAFEQEWKWVWNHQIDHKGGDWFGNLPPAGGEPTWQEKGGAWKASYHNGRALMRVSQALQSLLDPNAIVPSIAARNAVNPAAGTVTAATPAKAGQFVQTSGTKFTFDGRPFYVAGTSNHYLGWGTRREVDDGLQAAKAMNFNVVRTILHSVIGSPDESAPNAKKTIWNFRSTNDSSNMGMHGVYLLYWDAAKNNWAWNDSSVNGLGRWDYVIKRAGELGIKLDISLIDFWQWAGGTQQINAWYGLDERYTSFYTDARTKDLYKQWVAHVLNRTNEITGIKYKDDPTIFAWDLMNEPEVSSVELAQSWMREMSAHIKAIDSNHLLTTGSEGFYGGRGGSDPETELALPNIDFGTWHTYPTYHDITPAQVIDRIKQHGATAAKVGKPVLLQEFGYPDTKPDQAAVYRSWTDALYQNPNSAGWIVWRLEGRVVAPPTRDFPAAEADPLGDFPVDNGEHFSLYNNGQPAAQVVADAAARMTARNK